MSCGCKCRKNKNKSPISFELHLALIIIGLIMWWLLYRNLPQLSNFITYTLFAVPKNTRLGASLAFFFYDTPKVLMLLILVVYLVGLLRSFVTPAKTRRILVGKNEFIGNILAALFGIVTPFCSCSAVPLFIGLVTAGIPLGVTFSFLISAPMVNEIALVLLYGLLGWKIAAIYLLTGVTIAIIAGFVIGHLQMERFIADWVRTLNQDQLQQDQFTKNFNLSNRMHFAWQAVREIVGRVWIYMIIGIGVGAAIHGYVPQNLMIQVMGKDSWWSVPLAILIGIPIYSNAAGVIPVVEALLGKGAALGTVLAFMMSVIALSLPEMMILRRVLKPRLIFVFICIVGLGILLVGYLYNWVI